MSSPKPDLKELAKRMVRKAQSDQIAIEKLGDDVDVPDDVIGFHTQQAIEKLLKAALANAGVTPPRTHDLGILIEQLNTANVPAPISVTDAYDLIPWAVEFRYDDPTEEKLDRAVARKTVDQIRKWVDGLLKAP